jgi:hypothetical protein
MFHNIVNCGKDQAYSTKNNPHLFLLYHYLPVASFSAKIVTLVASLSFGWHSYGSTAVIL